MISELIKKLRSTDDPKEQDQIKDEIDLEEEKLFSNANEPPEAL